MSVTYEGTIEIPLEDFWQWVAQHAPTRSHEVAYGVPRVNVENSTLDIDFAASDECDPRAWAEQPRAVTQWDDLRSTSIPRRSEIGNAS